MAEGTALIIEDSYTQAHIIGRMLGDDDWAYLSARTIAEGCQFLVRHRPALIFLDVFVGEENGLTCLPEIRDLAPEAIIAVMTAGTRSDEIEDILRAARRANVDYVLRKPFSRKQVRAIVQAAEQDIAEARRRPHALVVDDSDVVATLTAQMLGDQGFRVSTAKTMEDALADVDIAHVDVAICDIFMPGMGGLEGIRRIKASWPAVKVVAMSAGLEKRVTPERAVSAAIQAGADGEIHKPFKSLDFINTILGVMAA
ncbi:MAG: response regulator [Asticcacaulis sp.]|nr:response regulator [Asticcacaulis sp.]